MISVASVPSDHVYVRHLAYPPPVDHLATAASVQNQDGGDAVDSRRVLRLPDPTPAGSPAPGQWWPPRLLDAHWLDEHVDRFDLLHVHFGFESFTEAQLAEVVDVLEQSSTPLVLTVHDLHNPHFADNSDHLARLDVLIPAASAVITLTEGVAAAIEERWGTAATVIPHPHVVPLDRMEQPRPETDSFVVAVHAKSLRANLDPLTLMDALVEAARSLPNTTVRLDIDDEVFDSTSHAYSPTTGAKLLDYNEFPEVDVRVHARFDDEQLWDYLSSVDVSVLPYRFGTHSGWLEACRDLGTTVVAPTCGHYAEQGECESFEMTPDSFDAASLTAAVVRAHEGRSAVTPVGATARRSQREAIASAHGEVYRDVIGGRR